MRLTPTNYRIREVSPTSRVFGSRCALPPLGKKKSLRMLISFPPFDGFLTISLGGDNLCLPGAHDLLFPFPTLCLLGVLGNCPTL